MGWGGVGWGVSCRVGWGDVGQNSTQKIIIHRVSMIHEWI